jgi:hypothetical protein
MAYNTGVYKHRSAVLDNLDCSLNVKAVPSSDGYIDARFTFSANKVLAPGECIGMLRVGPNTVVLGAELYWHGVTSSVLAVGDPFACARLLGPIHTTVSRGMNQAVSGFGTCAPWGTCGTLNKMGVNGDGCGVFYRFTCETDIVLTNLYHSLLANNGGWVGGNVNSAASDAGAQAGSAISAGTVHLILFTKKATSVS